MTKGAPLGKNARDLTKTVIDGLPVTVEAVLGTTQMSVGEINRLAPGDSFTLDRAVGDPVELRINGVAIAFGELVAVEGKFGVRIAKVAGA
ncbi:MAG: FliM/FliN family flagellar motor switch protein [Novosphingobium sp.]|uniref:FliM/FliN family flagellar motor switch protein n=1 Tax=Novosphingobium sp. TaxID=1874826 RepID=UPI0032B7472D